MKYENEMIKVKNTICFVKKRSTISQKSKKSNKIYKNHVLKIFIVSLSLTLTMKNNKIINEKVNVTSNNEIIKQFDQKFCVYF